MSSIPHSVLWTDETPQNSSKILHCASYFHLSSQCVIWWWNTASHAWYLTSKIPPLLHRFLGGGGGKKHNITTCYQWVPNWLFWLWDLPYLKAGIQDLKATWWDSGSKVCWGCRMPKIAIWIMGLRENLGGDYRINETLWGEGDCTMNLWECLHGRLSYYKHWS